MHNEKLEYLLFTNIMKIIKPRGVRWMGNAACMWEMRHACKFWFESLNKTVWGVGLDRSDTEILGSNPTQGMDIRPYLSVLCCPV